MDIKRYPISIRKVVEGYEDDEEEGVFAYGGKLNIRPKYQREFVYNDKQSKSVINTIMKGFPLNVMYWVDNGDGNYEVLDGQQRIISICEFVEENFSIKLPITKFYDNLTDGEKEKILNYELMVYICKGEDREKLDWFEIVNIAGLELKKQELRNAIYTGEWLTDAKRYFSKTGCPASDIAKSYMNGSPLRQDYLETAISWISHRDNCQIEDYMAKHQNKTTANELRVYFEGVISWVKANFPKKRKDMKGVPFGILYNEFKDETLDPKKLEKEIDILMKDKDVTNNKGIYSYVLNRDEKELNIRQFDDNDKGTIYAQQNGLCTSCNKPFEQNEMEGDHIIPWSKGGKTELDNCQMLCMPCNRKKSAR